MEVLKMNKTELAQILTEMYDNAPYGDASVMIHLFGVKYAKDIRENGYTPLEIIKEAQNNYGSTITDNYQVEINKMIKLSKYVIDREKIIQYINMI
jgi:hypothetical protein